uniref:Thaumatin-like protein n=1 Tax=Panagrellus redivivus TaxID=6233 RepID=A0A7E4VHF0_PANRE
MFIKAFFLVNVAVVVFARDIHIINNCGYKIWPGWYGQNGTPDGGGTTLNPGASHTINVPNDWTSGRIWARTGCDGNFNCDTGSCGNSEHCNGKWGAAGPSLAEFGLHKWQGLDFYDVSLVDGFNVQVKIKPNGGSGDCKAIGACRENLLDSCPNELKLVKNGHTVECQSACTKFHNPEYCCTGDHGKAETCGPSKYSRFFKERCPNDYSYAFDDKTSTFTCKDANYEVHFC